LSTEEGKRSGTFSFEKTPNIYEGRLVINDRGKKEELEQKKGERKGIVVILKKNRQPCVIRKRALP